MVWRLLCLGLGLMELRIILQQVLFTSCAAGTSVWLILLASLGALASTATGGRRVGLIMSGAQPGWAVTTSYSMLMMCTRRMVRLTAGTVSPSTALVLY